ncbi:hypothetical protein [Citromicrobium sp. JLT1363]|uniref:hypothetical protein n=1 Tax=Citromicrobium sp. JLT1363 TaxID=517722 RepID=UPI000225E01E|nr:hypothetical protein [Citromicrobium sp. JLT1363]
MHDLPDMDALRSILDHPIDPTPKTLLRDRLDDSLHCGLHDLTHVLVIEAGDTEEAVIDAIGFSPMRSRIDDLPNMPDWDWIEAHAGWWELILTVGNQGFAYILMVEDADGSPFAKLCREHAT